VKSGADDYISKDDLSRLVPAIRHALSIRKPLERLTPRQREVLCLLSQGFATRDIASRLSLSVKTIETHRAEVMKRLGLHDVPRLVRFAIRVRLIALE
jgi:DNA-binding NarL/FixJ family response regulator